MKPMTSHEMARVLMELPDKPIEVVKGEGQYTSEWEFVGEPWDFWGGTVRMQIQPRLSSDEDACICGSKGANPHNPGCSLAPGGEKYEAQRAHAQNECEHVWHYVGKALICKRCREERTQNENADECNETNGWCYNCAICKNLMDPKKESQDECRCSVSGENVVCHHGRVHNSKEGSK